MSDSNALGREIALFYAAYSAEYVAAMTGRPEGDEFFYRKYYSVPMYIGEADPADAGEPRPGRSRWLLTDSAIREFLVANETELAARGYHHAKILDRVVRVLNSTRVNLEIVVSRLRADDVEIERWAVGYGIAKLAEGWRIIDLYTAVTTADTVAEAWPPATAL
ncbi:hypothetical protein [Nocardia vulneris]|uniref:DUF6841 domain-containing protein n=1 Tax=Nocardia vulneris TaxID=1141657 RepID=A0ABR4ZLU9_9NOCA|nr:hypothetical protein [Nocardia vulneris]KIA66062.1 hypothetical protein FG87_04455 [Nocardia vulneris]